MEEYELMKDSKYRVYVSAVDKALKNFEYTSEWADLISALGKLNKVLSSYMKFQVIPRRIKISKRLAQCMHPALPSGVHLKALETYDIIFKSMGTSRLSHELFIYSAGLFPLLGHAAMNVRPSLLTVYETHFVPLGERLCPALSGFLSGVLPGLEEGSDHFDRTNSLLEKVCDGVGAARFYTCLWDCLSSNSTIRLPAICFILAHFNRKLSMEDQLHVMGTDIEVMVNGLCTAVQDTSVLVQRSALDLLLVGFPLHNSQLVRSDMIRLVTASLNTILRRDMSLNRRLFAWLLGSEVNLSLLSPEHPLIKSPAVSYFQLFSQEMLVQAIRTSLHQVLGETTHDLKPFRILVSLLDKPEIGPVILDYILYEVFRTLFLALVDSKKSSAAKPKDLHRSLPQLSGAQELFKSVNLLFSSLEPAYIWQYAGFLVERACRLHYDAMLAGQEDNDHVGTVKPVGSGQPCLTEVCLLVSCLLDAVPLESYIDTTLEHLPNLFLHIINQLCSSDIVFTPRQLVTCLQLCSKVLSRVQPHPSTSKSSGFTECTTRQRSKTVSFHQRRNSDSSQTLILEGNVDRLKDLSLSDHHLEADVNSKLEVSNRSASVGARLEADESVSSQISHSKRQSELASEPVSDNQTGSPNLVLDECRKRYQELFVLLITSNRMIDWQTHDFKELFEELMIVSYSEVEKNDTSGLEKLLEACLANSQPEYYPEQASLRTQTDSTKFRSWKESGVLDLTKQLGAQSSEWEEVFGAASTLLVDLSTFPSFCLTTRNYSMLTPTELPPWLQLLTVCCCWLGQSPAMQQTAICTLLELIALASRSTPQISNVESNQVTTVVLTPLLMHDDVQTLENWTCAMQVIAHWLWQHLSVGGALEARSVVLLQQLHDTVTSEDIVEATIGEYISRDNEERQLKGFQLFATLWHASRDIASKGKRPFLKSLLRMLDNLALPDSSPLKLAAQGWLLHTLLRGDIPRLLDPLLLPLLAPATARVSVLRVSIQHRSTVMPSEADKVESRIYAISSEDGNVIYHVSPAQSSDKRKESDSIRARRIFTVATLVKHCTYERNVAGLDNCPSSLMSWAIPSAVTGSYTLTNCASETPSSLSSCDSDSSSSCPATTSVSLNEDPPRTGAGNSSARSTASSGELITASANVMVRVDGRLVVENPVLKSLSSGFEEGDEDDFSDKISRGNTPVPSTGDTELEESVSAEDYFSRTGSGPHSRPRSRAESLAPSYSSVPTKNSLDTLAVEVRNNSMDKRKLSADARSPLSLHPLHSHMLLYCGVYDSARTLYSLRTLRNALATNPRTFLSCASTTGVARTSCDLLNLLARHRKSASGNNFHGDLANGFGGTGRSHMYLEVLLLTCLYYIRSYYPSLGQMRLTKQEIEGNQQVQVASLELLTLIFSELTSIVRDSGKGLANYIGDLLSRCKVQKIVLHCLVASVHDCASSSHLGQNLTFTEEIIHFNDPGRMEGEVPVLSPLGEAYQIQLLRLLLALTVLEHQVQYQKGEASTQQNTQSTVSSSSAPVSSSNSNSQQSGDIPTPVTRKSSELKYLVGRPIPQQPMFVAAILSALRMQGQLRWLHQQWTTLVTCSLPFMGQSLAHVVLSVIRQLCDNLRTLAPLYANSLSGRERINICLPADYAVTQLEALTILCHYCLLDRSQQHALNQPLLSASAGGSIVGCSSGVHGVGQPSHAAQIFNNLVHVFMTTPLHQDITQENVEPQLAARRALLYNLPQIISSTTTLWKAVTASTDKDQDGCSIAGSGRVVRHHLLEFLSPISMHHATNFLAAIAVVWQDRHQTLSELTSQTLVVPEVVPEQQVLVDLISAIRAMPVDTLVQTLHQLVKSPPSVHGTNHAVCLEVSALELLLCYLRQGNSPPLLLAESWSSVLLLLRDGLQPGLPPPAQFLLLSVLNEFVQRCPTPAEKRDVRDLQDITTKLVESCGSIAGARLEQTTWLRRNLAVKEEEREAVGPGPATLCQFSIQSQSVLAEQLASLLDVTFGSQEKEKVVNILTSLLYNIIPYLRNHSPRNAASFFACSELLASITAFQYTRKAWRRDVLDLLLEPALFQMEARALPHWRSIIDNLMSHDTTTFRDLMGRVSLGQGNSLSLFSSREQEYEQRAHLLKRLAFVILCGEIDQYQKYMPEIQERLAESLRLPQVVPAVQANVFLCFRVLLLRMSPHHVTSLWPVIISEMVQVFLQMEQELSSESEEFSSYIRLVSGLDLAWVSDRSNGLHARGHPHWLQLQLAAAHLLHLALQLPAHRLPQFQMYRWAFVGSVEPGMNNNNASVLACLTSSAPPTSEDDPGRSLQFIPHVSRIARLMDAKFEGPVDLPVGSALLPATQMVRCLQELHPFFSTLSAKGGHAISNAADTPQALLDLDKAIEIDFLEPMPAR